MKASDPQEHRYDDILNLPHPEPKHHARMPLSARAAQFSPFAALTGYDAALAETARRTQEKISLSEDAAAELNARLQALAARGAGTAVTITYFEPDARKAGGNYCTITGTLKCVDTAARLLRMESGPNIAINDIFELEGEIL